MSEAPTNDRDGRWGSLRRRSGAFVVDGFFRGLSVAGKLFPQARPERHGVSVVRDVPYVPDGLTEQRLDIYTPPTSFPRPWPVVLYAHGGGFRILSKESHWLMGLAFARQGYLVMNISYRLAPTHPFPAAIADTCAAYVYLAENAAAHGGDLSRVVLAGESAGANLVTALAIALSYRRPEAFARAVWDTGVVARAVAPACGMLQVSDPERFWQSRPLSTWVQDRLEEVRDAYLAGAEALAPGALDLADPLLVLERGEVPDRPLPPFFAPVGTRDLLLHDTRRLRAALHRMGVFCDARYYEGEVHAFHAMIWRENARRCWTDMFRFLKRQLAEAK